MTNETVTIKAGTCALGVRVDISYSDDTNQHCSGESIIVPFHGSEIKDKKTLMRLAIDGAIQHNKQQKGK